MTLKKAIKVFKVDFYTLKEYFSQGAPHEKLKNKYKIDPVVLATWLDDNTEGFKHEQRTCKG